MGPIIAAVAVAIGGLGVSAGLATAIATVIVVGTVAVGALALLMTLLPKPNIASQQRLTDTLSPSAPRIFVFGQTAFGNDERYWEVYGSNGYDQIIVCASHRVTSFGNFYAQGVPVLFSGNTATGTGSVGSSGFPGYIAPTSKYSGGTLIKDNCLKGVTGTVFPGTGTTGAGSLWTASGGKGCYMTGMAGYRLKWVVTQNTLPGGVPTQTIQEGEGSPVYDPRRDSTVGGSGSHRADDDTTWEYSPLDSNGVPIGRNNALQMITYLLGWHETNPVTGDKVPVIGRCVDPVDLNYADFINSANVCEAHGYYTDGVLAASDNHSNNESIIANGAQGFLTDPGGLWSYWVAHDDTASVDVAFTADDIISGVVWTPKGTISDLYNQVGGNFVDTALTNLYQPYPYPTVTDATYLAQDGNAIKVLPLDFQNVQDPVLAQKLARIALNRNRVTGKFVATFNYKALLTRVMGIVTLTFPNLGWTNKIFRVIGYSINPMGGVDLTLQEEYGAVYTGGTINTYDPAQSGSSYDVNTEYSVTTFAATRITTTLPFGGGSYSLIEVSWDPVDPNVQFIQLDYNIGGSIGGTTYWQVYGTMGSDTIKVFIGSPMTSTYNFRIRTVSKNFVFGPYATCSA